MDHECKNSNALQQGHNVSSDGKDAGTVEDNVKVDAKSGDALDNVGDKSSTDEKTDVLGQQKLQQRLQGLSSVKVWDKGGDGIKTFRKIVAKGEETDAPKKHTDDDAPHSNQLGNRSPCSIQASPSDETSPLPTKVQPRARLQYSSCNPHLHKQRKPVKRDDTDSFLPPIDRRTANLRKTRLRDHPLPGNDNRRYFLETRLSKSRATIVTASPTHRVVANRSEFWNDTSSPKIVATIQPKRSNEDVKAFFDSLLLASPSDEEDEEEVEVDSPEIVEELPSDEENEHTREASHDDPRSSKGKDDTVVSPTQPDRIIDMGERSSSIEKLSTPDNTPGHRFSFYPNPFEEGQLDGDTWTDSCTSRSSIVPMADKEMELSFADNHTNSTGRSPVLEALSLSSAVSSDSSITASLKSLESLLSSLIQEAPLSDEVDEHEQTLSKEVDDHEQRDDKTKEEIKSASNEKSILEIETAASPCSPNAFVTEAETPLVSNRRFEVPSSDEEDCKEHSVSEKAASVSASVNAEQLERALSQIQAVLKYHEENTRTPAVIQIETDSPFDLTVTSSVTSKSSYMSQESDDSTSRTSHKEDSNIEASNPSGTDNEASIPSDAASMQNSLIDLPGSMEKPDSSISENQSNQENFNPSENVPPGSPKKFEGDYFHHQALVVANDQQPKLVDILLAACRCTGPCVDQ
ncbi:MAG: hypothetical protein SGILL_006343 [Bacillariaceae sp.]